MYCGTAEDLRKAADAILALRCNRRNAIDWLLLVAVIVLVCLAVVWMATRRAVNSDPDMADSRYRKQFSFELDATPFSKPAKILLLNANPCIRIVEDFISREEANTLVRTYESTLKPSTVSANDSKQASTQSRSSSSAFLPAGSDKHKVLQDIENRLVLLTGLPVPHWETLQLTKYTKGQQYKPHFDWFDTSLNNRAITVFVYLNDVPQEQGGQTEFTDINLVVQPTLGRAVVWFNCSARGNSVNCDAKTKHAGKPPLYGVKYGLNCWARTAPYR
uniref:Prolyl 4-hydroxylase alpha subunit domain-containing protein n=1 Tax=viral metagenome TaxID=1070528 RepID=A0A6C0C171_9ZZZZ